MRLRIQSVMDFPPLIVSEFINIQLPVLIRGGNDCFIMLLSHNNRNLKTMIGATNICLSN